MNRSIIVAVILMLSSCATTLTQEGKRVRVIENPEFVSECKFLGPIEESHYSGWNPSDNKAQALNAARNTAGEMGGNTIRIVGELFRGVQADVYDCEY